MHGISPDAWRDAVETMGQADASLVVAASLASAALQLRSQITRFSMGGDIAGWPTIEEALAAMPAERIADERAGVDMLYSSGTTGRPKVVKVPLPEEEEIDAPNSLVMLASAARHFNSSAAPSTATRAR